MDENDSEVASVKDISVSKQNQFWLPLEKIVHENALIGDIKVGSNNFVRVVARTEALDSNVDNAIEGDDIKSANNITLPISDVRYDGKENLLKMARDYKIKYRCSFDKYVVLYDV